MLDSGVLAAVRYSVHDGGMCLICMTNARRWRRLNHYWGRARSDGTGKESCGTLKDYSMKLKLVIRGELYGF